MKNKLLAILVVLVCVLVFVLTVVFMIQYEPPNKCVYDLQGRAWHGMQVDVSFFTDNLTAEHRDGQVIFLDYRDCPLSCLQ